MAVVAIQRSAPFSLGFGPALSASSRHYNQQWSELGFIRAIIRLSGLRVNRDGVFWRVSLQP